MVGDSDTGRMPVAPLVDPGACGIAASEYPKLLERVPAIIYVADAGEVGRWHYVSPQIEQILGYTPAEWCADPGAVGRAAAPRGPRLGARARERDREHEPDDDAPLEYRMIHRDGRVVWIRDDARARAGEDGELRWHGMLPDITDRKQVEAELERRAAQQAAVALLGEHALEGATTTDLMQEAVDGAARDAGRRDRGGVGVAPRRGLARPAERNRVAGHRGSDAFATRRATARRPGTRS